MQISYLICLRQFMAIRFGNYYAVSKSMGKKLGVNAKASHILISYEGTKVPNKKNNELKKKEVKAEALLAQIKRIG
jgi:peptidyl-prolyl cis-trans isomerase D